MGGRSGLPASAVAFKVPDSFPVAGTAGDRRDAVAECCWLRLSWPRQVIDLLPERSRMWDHPEVDSCLWMGWFDLRCPWRLKLKPWSQELEVLKQYAFRDALA